MIPLPYWLTNIQFIIGAFGTFAFFSAAWLNIDSWTVRRESKTGLRTVGFLILAIWSAISAINLSFDWSSVVVAATMFIGVATITISFIIDKRPLQPKELAALKGKQPIAFPSQKTAPSNNKKTDSPQPKSIAKTPLLADQKSTQAKINIQPIKAVLKPMQKRKSIHLTIISITGIIVFFIVTWLSYSIATRFIKKPSTIDNPESNVEQIIINQKESLTPTPSPSPTEEPEEISNEQKLNLPTVTIQETGIGFLNVRQEPNASEELITKINPGESYPLLQENDGSTWYKIQLPNDVTGWISSKYANKNE